MAEAGYKASEKLAKMACDESGFGVFEDKIIKMIYTDQDHDRAGGAMQNAAVAEHDLARHSKGLHETIRNFEHESGNDQDDEADGKSHMLHSFGIVEPHKISTVRNIFDGRCGSSAER